MTGPTNGSAHELNGSESADSKAAGSGLSAAAPETDAAWSEDWLALVQKGRFTQARTVLRTLRSDPTDLAAVETLAEIQDLAREKDWERALGRIERLEELDPPLDVEALSGELRVLRDASMQLDRRESDAALELLTELEDPYLDAEAATQRGTAHILRNDTEAARAAFEHALQADPRHFRALTNLGNLELEAGDVDAAIEAYEAALRINDEFANAHHNLGVALRRKGHVARSVRSLRRAQKALQAREADRAKSAAKGIGGARFFRWLLIGGLAVALYFILQQRGIL